MSLPYMAYTPYPPHPHPPSSGLRTGYVLLIDNLPVVVVISRLTSAAKPSLVLPAAHLPTLPPTPHPHPPHPYLPLPAPPLPSPSTHRPPPPPPPLPHRPPPPHPHPHLHPNQLVVVAVRWLTHSQSLPPLTHLCPHPSHPPLVPGNGQRECPTVRPPARRLARPSAYLPAYVFACLSAHRTSPPPPSPPRPHPHLHLHLRYIF